MDNAVNALYIGFAIFVFVVATTVSFLYISQAVDTADYIVYNGDSTNFYENLNSSSKNRTVSVSDVISTIYRYNKETLCVTIDLGDDKIYKFDEEANTEEVYKLRNDSQDLKTYQKPATTAEEEILIAAFIKNVLKDYYGSSFIEEFVEVSTGGETQTGLDGSQVTLESGGSKVFVTYTVQKN